MANDLVAGYKVKKVNECYLNVEGILICSMCNNKYDELIAVKEIDKCYCYKCFFDNTKSIYKKGQDFIHITFIRN